MFSDREQKIINVIGKNEYTIGQIADKVFKGDPHAPLDANISISNSVTRIIKKCDHYNLRWTIKKERSAGKLYLRKVAV